MSAVDSITIIIGPPAAQEDKDALEELADASGISFQDAYIRRIAATVQRLSVREDGQASDLDSIMSDLLGRAVKVDDAVPTYYEKKENRYPAIIIPAASVTDATGIPMIEAITAVFRQPETPSNLAEKVGRKLDVESARVFVTYGASGSA